MDSLLSAVAAGACGLHKPHAVCLPFPAQGHINPMLKLSILLHHIGFHITFVNTDHNHRRLLQTRGPNSLDGWLDFRFESIPDGLPPTNSASQDIQSLNESIKKKCLGPFRAVLAKLNNGKDVIPPVSCVISDAIMSFAVVSAKEIGVPIVCFRTTSACSFLCNKHLRALIEKGILPFKDGNYLTNGHLEKTVDWIPELKSMRLKDFPTFIRTTDPNDLMLHSVIEETNGASKASALIFNTFNELENDILEALSHLCPPIYTIGPLQLLINQLPESSLKSSIGLSLWKEESECFQWLATQQPDSVLYVNFGSITVLTPQQITEFAWGLANSKKNFLWILRPDIVVGDQQTLPPEFVEETRGRGLISGWCLQEEVLKHSSVGGFLTHCGWNSTVESICNGIPMICWPFFADQQLNCRHVCAEWGVGMEIDINVKRDDVEKLVRDLMDGEKGKVMKKKAMELKRKAEEAIGRNGSSSLNVDRLVKEVLLEIGTPYI